MSQAVRVREIAPTHAAHTPVLVDSKVWIDLFGSDPNWFDWSAEQVAGLVDRLLIVINPIVYAEIAAGFASLEALDAALAPFAARREALPWEAAFLASQAFQRYRERGGIRRSPLPDFYIGAHAALRGYTLLTRDAARYRQYFRKLRIVAPD